MELFEKINEDIIYAMRAKDKVRTNVLRGVKKEFVEANIKLGKDLIISDKEGLLIIQRLAKQREDSAEAYKKGERNDLAEQELAELAILKEYLPKQMDEKELEHQVSKIIAQTKATSMKDMSEVMHIATQRLAGQATGKDISTMVKKLLQK